MTYEELQSLQKGERVVYGAHQWVVINVYNAGSYGIVVGLENANPSSWSMNSLIVDRNACHLLSFEKKFVNLSLEDYPHTCPRCASPAYVGFTDVDCSRRCRP